jgi:hypothetical protein
MEFIVAGVDKSGPSVYEYRYTAPTPPEFSGSHEKKFGVKAGTIKIVPIPTVDPDVITKPGFWNITTKPGEDIIPKIADKIVRFIHAAKAKLPGISDPITIAVINTKGFRFLNRGECTCK